MHCPPQAADNRTGRDQRMAERSGSQSDTGMHSRGAWRVLPGRRPSHPHLHGGQAREDSARPRGHDRRRRPGRQRARLRRRSPHRTGAAEVDTDVPLVSQRFLTSEDPSDASKVTLQAGQTLRRTDKQGDTGLLTADDRPGDHRPRHRHAVDDPSARSRSRRASQREEVAAHRAAVPFPFGTEKKILPVLRSQRARATKDIDFVEETEINGMKVYHFSQRSGRSTCPRWCLRRRTS